MSALDFGLFEYLDSVNCNHRQYVQLWKIFHKKRYNFSSNRDGKKKKYFVNIKFCCASNDAIKNVKVPRKKSTFPD